MLAVGVLLGATAMMFGTFFSRGPASRDTLRLSVQAPADQEFRGSFLAVAADGRTIAYTAHQKDSGGRGWVRRVFLRRLHDFEVVGIDGSDGVAGQPVQRHVVAYGQMVDQSQGDHGVGGTAIQ